MVLVSGCHCCWHACTHFTLTLWQSLSQSQKMCCYVAGNSSQWQWPKRLHAGRHKWLNGYLQSTSSYSIRGTFTLPKAKHERVELEVAAYHYHDHLTREVMQVICTFDFLFNLFIQFPFFLDSFFTNRRSSFKCNKDNTHVISAALKQTKKVNQSQFFLNHQTLVLYKYTIHTYFYFY